MVPLPPVYGAGELAEVPDVASPELREWASFLSKYAKGDWPVNAVPTRPRFERSTSHSSLAGKQATPYSPRPNSIYDSVEITAGLARKVHDFCREYDYLPPPRSPHEQLRRKLIDEYDLNSAVQQGNIQAAVDLMHAFFPDAVVTFTLFENREQAFVAVAGPRSIVDKFNIKRFDFVPSETSLCGHSVLLDDRILHIPRLGNDWRYRSNPYTAGGIQSYVGSPVWLATDPMNASPSLDEPAIIGIGALNVLFITEPLEALDATQSMVINHVTKMLETQLRATWEGHVRTREAKVRRAITDLIEEAFVQGVDKHGATTRTVKEADGFFADLAASALNRLMTLSPKLDTLSLVDMQAVSLMPGTKGRREYFANRLSSHAIATIASARSGQSELPNITDATLWSTSLTNCQSQVTFKAWGAPSGLEGHLPDGCNSHLLMPFSVGDHPLFILLATSSSPDIDSATVSIARTLGSILLARAAQSRVLEADAAKTAFLSSISHELRTPLHSIISGVNLIRDSVNAAQWDEITPLLTLVESSGQSLYRILNDVLDFGKTHAENQGITRTVSNVVHLAKDAARMCLTQASDLDNSSTVQVEYEDRDWQATVDVAGILINGISNAMKFCKQGSITISLTTAPGTDQVITRIKDTGMGMNETMLHKAVEPFTKGDQHSPGAGLGLYITQSLVTRMGGSFALRSAPGQGTVFEAIIPMLGEPSDSGGPIVQETIANSRIAAEARPARTTDSVIPSDAMLQSGESSHSTDTDRLTALRPSTVPVVPFASRPVRVMVVDDNKICLKVISTALRRGPTKVVCKEALDGRQAVDAFADFRPDLVITDISMPVLDGVQAAQEMRAISERLKLPPCRIYALTGLGSSDPRLQTLGVGGSAALDGWLVKGKDDLVTIHRIVGEVNEELLKAADHVTAPSAPVSLGDLVII
ncbi:hypothetical protein IAU60_003746 [Kwoniella sp. DSM 27419]